MYWNWDTASSSSNIVLSRNGSEVMFHPRYSVGTACVRGSVPLTSGQHYWEIAVLGSCFGTDIMIGVVTDKFDVQQCEYEYTSMLGMSAESWGLSFRGNVQHKSSWRSYDEKFGQGSVVAVHLDLWNGQLSYYIDGRPIGVAFHGISAKKLYPVISSTAAKSHFRLISAAHYDTNLQFLCCMSLRKAIPYNRSVLECISHGHISPNLRGILENNLCWLLNSKQPDVSQSHGKRELVLSRRERFVAHMVSLLATDIHRSAQRRLVSAISGTDIDTLLPSTSSSVAAAIDRFDTQLANSRFTGISCSADADATTSEDDSDTATTHPRRHPPFLGNNALLMDHDREAEASDDEDDTPIALGSRYLLLRTHVPSTSNIKANRPSTSSFTQGYSSQECCKNTSKRGSTDDSTSQHEGNGSADCHSERSQSNERERGSSATIAGNNKRRRTSKES